MSVAVIRVQNAQRKLRVKLANLQKFSERALQFCLAEPSRAKGNLTALSQVDTVLISDRRMAELHKRFMNIAGPTDVITFQHGEIFISVETARRNARLFRTSIERELRLYLVHGLLHLHGFDDRTEKGSRAMLSVQERILARAVA